MAPPSDSVDGSASASAPPAGSESTSSACAPPPTSTMDADVAAVLALAQGRHLVDGTWGSGAGTVATIDVTLGQQPPTITTGCYSALQVDATVTVKTRDGLVDARGTTLSIDYSRSASVAIPLPTLLAPAGSLGPFTNFPFPFSFTRTIASTGTTLVLSFATAGSGTTRAAIVVDGQNVVGLWSSLGLEVPHRREPQYELPADLVTACAPAGDFTNAPEQFTVLPSAEAARAARVGTWIRCRAFGGPAHEGIQIGADGTWSYLRYESGAFVSSPGLQRAGTIEVIDETSNGAGVAQVNLVGPNVGRATWVFGNRLIMDDDTAPPDWGVSVYVLTDRPVTPAQNAFVAGQRAGMAGCTVGELGTIDPDLGAPLNTTLTGDWIVCSGEFLEGYGRLRFDGHGGFAFVDEAGVALPSSPFTVVHPQTMPPQVPRATMLLPQVTAEGGDEWTITFSERPLKMWVSIESQHAVKRQLVLSAVAP